MQTSTKSISPQNSSTPSSCAQPAVIPCTQTRCNSARDKRSFSYICRSFLAGGIAGCAAKTVIAPLDRVKILFQAHSPHYARYSGSFLGVFKAAEEIYKQYGVRGLFQGHSATLLRIFPYAAVKFMAYEQFKVYLMPTKQFETPVRQLLAGSLAGVTTVFATYPLELIRVRLAFEVRNNSSFGILQTIKSIWSEPVILPLSLPHLLNLPRTKILTPSMHPISQYHPGRYSLAPLLNFYRGFLPTVWGMIPYAGVSFMVYEGLISYFKSSTQSIDPETGKLLPWYTLLSGGIAGAVSQTVSYPFEVVRRRMQVSGMFNRGITSNPNVRMATELSKQEETFMYRNTTQTVKYVYRTMGWRGFFVGLSIGYLKVTPMSMASFWVYEFSKRILDIN